MVLGLPAWLRAPARQAEIEQIDHEEREQIERARQGADAAVGWLIARYRQRVVRLAAHVLRRPEEAEDAAQEAFLRAFRSLNAFRSEGRFSTWLYRITLRVCLDQLRLKRWDGETSLDAPDLQADLAHHPAQGAEARMLVEMLLDRLSPPMRAMLVLRELEGLEYEEIARVLEIPVGRVKWRLHEARVRFRVLWSETMQETDDV